MDDVEGTHDGTEQDSISETKKLVTAGRQCDTSERDTAEIIDGNKTNAQQKHIMGTEDYSDSHVPATNTDDTSVVQTEQTTTTTTTTDTVTNLKTPIRRNSKLPTHMRNCYLYFADALSHTYKHM